MGAAEALGGASQDCFCYSLWVASDIAVPYAKNAPALSLQPFIANAIAVRVSVLASVNFDDQLRLAACEIGNVWADRQLSRELRPVTGQEVPNPPFLAGSI